jgi:CheY-like chemotaxis protein
MALRVLLADENVTIKKVIQLSLQDYAVNVKSVNLGIDVIEVAQSFQPDIILADILLQKRSGYDVCSDIKSHPQLSNTPVVLLWSGFMELDQERFEQVKADGQLEKPFDKDKLRELVQTLVSKTKDQSISDHLKINVVPNFQNKKQPAAESADPEDLAETNTSGKASISDQFLAAGAEQKKIKEESQVNIKIDEIVQKPEAAEEPDDGESSWNMESFDEIEEFVQKPLDQLNDDEPIGEQDDDEEDWVQQPIANQSANPIMAHLKIPKPDFKQTPAEQPKEKPQTKPQPSLTETLELSTEDAEAFTESDLSRFKVKAPIEDDDDEKIQPKHDLNVSAMEDDVGTLSFITEDSALEDSGTELHHNRALTEDLTDDSSETKTQAHIQPGRMSEEALEEVLRSQSREVIESVVWKIVPDLAEKIIREELEKIMKESEAQP